MLGSAQCDTKKINDSKTRQPMIKAGIFDYSLEAFLVHMTELYIHNTFFFRGETRDQSIDGAHGRLLMMLQNSAGD